MAKPHDMNILNRYTSKSLTHNATQAVRRLLCSNQVTLDYLEEDIFNPNFDLYTFHFNVQFGAASLKLSVRSDEITDPRFIEYCLKRRIKCADLRAGNILSFKIGTTYKLIQAMKFLQSGGDMLKVADKGLCMIAEDILSGMRYGKYRWKIV